MKQIRIAFFDIDGTLIDMKIKRPTDRMLETLRALQEGGIKLCIATGRAPIAVPAFDGITFDAYLTFNGSLCYTKDATISDSPIPEEDVQRIIRNAAAIGRPVAAASRDRIACNGTDRDLADYFAISRQVLTIAPDFDRFSHEKIYQIMLGCRSADYPALLAGTRSAKIAAWWDRAADIIPGESGKGIGVRRILDYYHLDRASAIAFGDGENDSEMLTAVGRGVAMGNASDSVKRIADDVCGTCADDGISSYCRAHGLIP